MNHHAMRAAEIDASTDHRAPGTCASHRRQRGAGLRLPWGETGFHEDLARRRAPLTGGQRGRWGGRAEGQAPECFQRIKEAFWGQHDFYLKEFCC